MPAIRVSTNENTPAVLGRDLVDDEMLLYVNEGQLNSTMRTYHPGGERELQMFELDVPADTVIGQHAHDEDEIIYVLEGELRFGSYVLEPGASVYIPGNTLYSLHAGPKGLRFLNFRARQDLTYITKEQFVERRKGRRSSEAD
jgi:quercetin dioxygenase-like cupin family protein